MDDKLQSVCIKELKTTKAIPSVVSLFSGAGGFDQGFRAAGYKIACCVELEKWACDTLRANHPNTPVMGPPLHDGDIKNISAREICKFAGIEIEDVDVLIGGPPCQPFSQAAAQRFLKKDDRFKRLGFDDQIKGNLLFDFIRLIIEFQPRVFVLENVPGLMTMDNGVQLGLALEKLHAHGYCTSPLQELNAVDYGVPQFRERLIIWGSRTINNPTLPIPTHNEGKNSTLSYYTTVAHALVKMPQNLPNHKTRNHVESSIIRYRKLKFGEREKRGRVDRLDPRKPSKTVIAGGTRGGGRSHLHPFIARTLTVRECARLQTFDDEYIFKSSIARQFTQVGNAVPPLLAEHIARHIKLQEFSLPVNQPIHHGQYLCHHENLEILVDQLLEESRLIKPEWIYDTHILTTEPVIKEALPKSREKRTSSRSSRNSQSTSVRCQ